MEHRVLGCRRIVDPGRERHSTLIWAGASPQARLRISLTSIECALWLMKATTARMVANPRTAATVTDRFGITGSPPCSRDERTARSTMRQKVKVATTSPMTRVLNGWRNRVCTTRGESWLDPNWISSREIEKAMPAKVMVALAIVVRTARALSTVDVSPRGHRAVSIRSSTAIPTWLRMMAATTPSMGMKNRLACTRSTLVFNRSCTPGPTSAVPFGIVAGVPAVPPSEQHEAGHGGGQGSGTGGRGEERVEPVVVPSGTRKVSNAGSRRPHRVRRRPAGAEVHRHIPERCNVSVDATVTKDLIETLEDGREGFAQGAEKLDDSDRELAAIFRRFSAQRASFRTELQDLARSYGDRIDESGSVAATLHRGWMSLKDALTGSSPSGVLDAAEQGEDHAVKEYDKALSSELSPELRAVVERQSADVRAAHDEVRSLRDSQG